MTSCWNAAQQLPTPRYSGHVISGNAAVQDQSTSQLRPKRRRTHDAARDRLGNRHPCGVTSTRFACTEHRHPTRNATPHAVGRRPVIDPPDCRTLGAIPSQRPADYQSVSARRVAAPPSRADRVGTRGTAMCRQNQVETNSQRSPMEASLTFGPNKLTAAGSQIICRDIPAKNICMRLMRLHAFPC